MIFFERQEYVTPERPFPLDATRVVPIANGRYLQRVGVASPLFGSHECERCVGEQVSTGRLVFLKLVRERWRAERELQALRAVGSEHAPEVCLVGEPAVIR